MYHSVRPARPWAARLAPFVLALVLPLAAQAQPAPVPVDAARSHLAYTGHHKLHDWSATSKAVRGTLHIDRANPAASRVELVVPVESFDSGNSNRDSNMLDAVEAERYADVRFTSERITVEAWEKTATGYRGRWRVHGPMTFHGKTNAVEIPVDVTVEGQEFTAKAAFQVSLDQFKVRRPKLMLMPIDDALDLQGEIRATLNAGT